MGLLDRLMGRAKPNAGSNPTSGEGAKQQMQQASQLPTSLRGVFATDSGMLALWNPDAFRSIVDYQSWERELLEDRDITRHIAAGSFVPINIQSDGAFACEIRSGTAGSPATLTARETRHLVVRSLTYLFWSAGTLRISGIEQVSRDPDKSVGTLKTAPGDYSVTVHLIAWDDEPGMKQPDGRPSASALPDFVILLNPVSNRSGVFRLEVQTFEPERRVVSEHTVHLIGSPDDETAKISVERREKEATPCYVVFSYRGKSLEVGATDYFEAFCQIRLRLEEEKLIPFCYGASLNVQPSGMSRDMGGALKAYRLTKGHKPGQGDLVDIFAEGADVIPAYVRVQKEFYADWLISIGANP